MNKINLETLKEDSGIKCERVTFLSLIWTSTEKSLIMREEEATCWKTISRTKTNSSRTKEMACWEDWISKEETSRGRLVNWVSTPKNLESQRIC